MICLYIEHTMCQSVKGHLIRSTRILHNSDSDGDYARSLLNDRSSTSNCVEARTCAFGRDVSGDELCREDVQLVRQCSKLSDGERRRRALVTFAEAPLHSGDTLVTIALKYGCRVSELKQLNRLISDQDVFGLRTIRVPVKRYGVVEELIRADMEEEQSNVKLGVVEVSESESSDTAENDDDNDVTSASANSLQQPLLQHTEGNHLSKQGQKALKHLHAVDSNVRTAMSAVASSRTLCRGASSRAVVHRRRQDSLQYWSRVRRWVIIIGLTFIVVPLILVLYVKFSRSGS